MIRNQIIALISNILSINREYITEESNLMLLFILSDYLDNQSKANKHAYKISKVGLTHMNPNIIKRKNSEIIIDIDFLFENNDGISIKYRGKGGSRGLDSFYGYQLVELIFILEIESKLGIQINDQAWERIESVGELLQAIKEKSRKL